MFLSLKKNRYFFAFLRKTVQKYKTFCIYPKKIVILRNIF